MITITYHGDRPQTATLRVTEGGLFQPWHLAQFAAAAETGIEFVFNHDDQTVADTCGPPFQQLGDGYYRLKINTVLSVPTNYGLLVMPHSQYYTDWTTPLAIPMLWQADWWPDELEVVFRHTPGGSVFCRGKPFAQAVVVPPFTMEKMRDKDVQKKKFAKSYIDDNRHKYITRQTAETDNLYNVLANLNQDNRLPPELGVKTRKYRVINNVEMGEDKKTNR